MSRFLCLLLCCSYSMAEEPKKPEKPQTPKQIREAEEKVIKDKMAPIEQDLKEIREDLAAAKVAKVGGAPGSKLLKGGRHQWTAFRTEEKKKEVCQKYEAEIKKLNEQLAPFKAELEALKKKPLPKPDEKPKADDKPKPPAKPEAKP